MFLYELGIPFYLKMIVMRKNVYEVEPARQLAIKLGAGDFRFDPMVNANFLPIFILTAFYWVVYFLSIGYSFAQTPKLHFFS